MTLRENYKVMDDGIWISRKELEEWRDHYHEVALEATNIFQQALYTGKQDVIIDLLKTIENENDKRT